MGVARAPSKDPVAGRSTDVRGGLFVADQATGRASWVQVAPSAHPLQDLIGFPADSFLWAQPARVDSVRLHLPVCQSPSAP
jgi:hypothetical protein